MGAQAKDLKLLFHSAQRAISLQAACVRQPPADGVAQNMRLLGISDCLLAFQGLVAAAFEAWLQQR